MSNIELLPPTMNSNIIMLNFLHRHNATDFAVQTPLDQFSVTKLENGSFMLSTPLTAALEDKYTGMVHGAKARAKDKDKPEPTPPTGGNNPDGTPPGGGTPGSTSVWQQTFTEARAA